MLERYMTVEAKRKRVYERKLRADRRKDRKRLAEEMSQRLTEARLQKRMLQQGQQLGKFVGLGSVDFFSLRYILLVHVLTNRASQTLY